MLEDSKSKLKKIILDLNKKIIKETNSMFNTNNEIIKQLDNLTIRFDQNLYSLNMAVEEKTKKLSFLNNKRNFQGNENNNYNYNLFNSNKIDNCVNINLDKSNKIIKQSNDLINKNKKEKSVEIDDNINGNNCQNEPNKKNNLENFYEQNLKVKSNNKMVYINKKLIKQRIKKTEIKDGKKARKSLYRGVSKNGSKWQTIIHYKKGKGYIGMYPSEELAARVYDIIALKNRGIHAKTNFIYNLHQINNIISSNIDVKSSNIHNIISDLIK